MRSRLAVGDGTTRCLEEFAAVEVNERVDGNYVWLPFTATCGSSQLTKLSVDYRLMQDIDPSHRGLMTITGLGHHAKRRSERRAVDRVWIINPRGSHSPHTCEPASGTSGAESTISCSSYPYCSPQSYGGGSALGRRAVSQTRLSEHPQGRNSVHRRAFVTLSLAAFDVVRLPSRLTESVIAASIIVAALKQHLPQSHRSPLANRIRLWPSAWFWIASVLADMGLPPGARALCWSRSTWALKQVSSPLCWLSCRWPMPIRATRF